ncbi:MAG TPA: hypothetical protein VH309_11250, partial [Elusimicrobiota bacterium]|nr:hypothetical protein [Elusimicrobiota bacterium]
MRLLAAAACAAALALIGCAQLGLVPNGIPPAAPPPPPALRPEREISATFGAALIADQMVSGVKVEVLVVGN